MKQVSGSHDVRRIGIVVALALFAVVALVGALVIGSSASSSGNSELRAALDGNGIDTASLKVVTTTSSKGDVAPITATATGTANLSQPGALLASHSGATPIEVIYISPSQYQRKPTAPGALASKWYQTAADIHAKGVYVPGLPAIFDLYRYHPLDDAWDTAIESAHQAAKTSTMTRYVMVVSSHLATQLVAGMIGPLPNPAPETTFTTDASAPPSVSPDMGQKVHYGNLRLTVDIDSHGRLVRASVAGVREGVTQSMFSVLVTASSLNAPVDIVAPTGSELITAADIPTQTVPTLPVP